MVVSNNNSEQEFLNGEQIRIFQEFDFSLELKNILVILFDNLKIQSKNLFENYNSLSSKEFSNPGEYSFNLLKEILIKIENLSEDDFEESEKCFKSYYTQLELLIEKFEDNALKNSVILKDALLIYVTELYKIIEQTSDELCIGYNKKLENQNISNQKPVNENYATVFIVEKDDTFAEHKQINFKHILKQKFPEIIQDCVVNFVEAIDSFHYQKFAKINSLNKLLESYVPSKQSGINNNIKVSKPQSVQLSTILSAEDQLVDQKFESYLTELKPKFDLKIEDSFCNQISILNDPAFLAQNQIEIDLFKILNEQIIQIIEKSQLIYKSYFSEIKLECLLEKTRIIVYQNIQMLYFRLEQIIKIHLEGKNEKLIRDIQATIKDYTDHRKPEFEDILKTDNKLEMTIYSDIENTIAASISTINNQINTIPAIFELIKDVIFTDFKLDSVMQSQTFKIRAKKITEVIVGNELFTLIQTLPLSISNKMNEIDNEILNQNRLIKYSIFNQDNNRNNNFIENDEVDILQFLNQKLSETGQNRNKIEKINHLLYNDLFNSFYDVYEKLTLSFFKNEANTFAQYIPKRNFSKGISSLRKIFRSINKYFDKLVNKFWLHQSDAHILAEDLWGKQTFISSVYRIIDKTEHLTLNEKIKSELPFYYKHLFIDDTNFNNEFWIGRKKELERAQIAFHRFQDGISGSLMITGERFSGKSFMTRYFCSEILKSKKNIIINAPEYGFADSKLLLKKFQEQSGLKGDLAKILSAIEPETIVVFEDLELWWEKSENGDKLIQQIFEILEQYCQRIFFIVTMNSYSYRAIEKMIKFQSVFLDIIYCKPVNSKSLQDIILFRHQASGLKFEFKHGIAINGKKTEESFKQKNFANLFSKYFNYSNGNIGVCLLAWMSNIIKIDGNRIIMQLPKSDDIPEFKHLDKDDILLLYQMFIHKKMDSTKISRVLLQSEKIVQKQLDFFKRTGIVVLQNSVYEINPYINHIVTSYLKNQEML